MAKCWCGRNHDTIAQRGGAQNGPIKHSVINWKLYELRKDGHGGELVDVNNPGKRRVKA